MVEVRIKETKRLSPHAAAQSEHDRTVARVRASLISRPVNERPAASPRTRTR